VTQCKHADACFTAAAGRGTSPGAPGVRLEPLRAAHEFIKLRLT